MFVANDKLWLVVMVKVLSDGSSSSPFGTLGCLGSSPFGTVLVRLLVLWYIILQTTKGLLRLKILYFVVGK